MCSAGEAIPGKWLAKAKAGSAILGGNCLGPTEITLDIELRRVQLAVSKAGARHFDAFLLFNPGSPCMAKLTRIPAMFLVPCLDFLRIVLDFTR